MERGLDALEDEIMRRAKDGVEEPVYYRGAVVGETRRYSYTLAMFILKSKRREIWGGRTQIDMKYDWSHLTEAERMRKAMQMLDVAEELVNRPTVIDATPVPTGNQILVGGYIYDRPTAMNSPNRSAAGAEPKTWAKISRRNRAGSTNETKRPAMVDSARNPFQPVPRRFLVEPAH